MVDFMFYTLWVVHVNQSRVSDLDLNAIFTGRGTHHNVTASDVAMNQSETWGTIRLFFLLKTSNKLIIKYTCKDTWRQLYVLLKIGFWAPKINYDQPFETQVPVSRYFYQKWYLSHPHYLVSGLSHMLAIAFGLNMRALLKTLKKLDSMNSEQHWVWWQSIAKITTILTRGITMKNWLMLHFFKKRGRDSQGMKEPVPPVQH